MFKVMKIRATGVAPLLMHSGRGANPIDPLVQMRSELSRKRNKTDDDYQRLSELDWNLSVYADDAGHPVLPGECIEGTLINAAKKFKLGKKAQASMFCDGAFPLIYSGPQTIDAIIKDRRFWDVRAVRVQQARVMRTRPRFDEWAVEFDIHYRADELNTTEVKGIVENAGQLVGFCDYRPKFGRFMAKIL